jgi:hypothetical protein
MYVRLETAFDRSNLSQASACQGLGAGKLLIEAVRALAQENGIDTIALLGLHLFKEADTM